MASRPPPRCALRPPPARRPPPLGRRPQPGRLAGSGPLPSKRVTLPIGQGVIHQAPPSLAATRLTDVLANFQAKNPRGTAAKQLDPTVEELLRLEAEAAAELQKATSGSLDLDTDDNVKEELVQRIGSSVFQSLPKGNSSSCKGLVADNRLPKYFATLAVTNSTPMRPTHSNLPDASVKGSPLRGSGRPTSLLGAKLRQAIGGHERTASST
eukprot:GHVT01035391.1.p2 GENE.GHVT01035391.1~~GHVT01035391.1.p2  ORF type:complete len:211 (-),score=42.27 GHVT01035391.1:253-885(-)